MAALLNDQRKKITKCAFVECQLYLLMYVNKIISKSLYISSQEGK